MKRIVLHVLRPALACLLLATAFAAPAAAPATASPLPKDSVYQLPLPLTDQHGKTSDWRHHRGKPQVVAMFYTSCQYICPLIVDSGKAVEHALTPAEQAKLGFLLISMDPKRDTPVALMRIAKQRKLDPARWQVRARTMSAASPACSACVTASWPMASSTTPARWCCWTATAASSRAPRRSAGQSIRSSSRRYAGSWRPAERLRRPAPAATLTVR